MKDQPPEESKDLDRDPVYYYSRENRLKKASRRVREFNEETDNQRGGAAKFLGTKGNALMLVSILIICAMFITTSRYNKKGYTVNLAGNNFVLSIASEEGIYILELVKNTPKNGESFTGEITIAVSPVTSNLNDQDEPRVFVHRVSLNEFNTETFQFALPFEEEEYYVILSTDAEFKSVKIKARS